MSNEIIFTTQIASIVAFLAALFGIYRSLVAQKDSIIQLLNERIKAQEEKIKDLQSQTPDALTAALSSRIETAQKEIVRLREDGGKHQDEINSKEDELQEIKAQLNDLISLIQDTDLLCNKCGAPLVRRAIYPIFGQVGGREVEADVEYVEYECGLSLRDGQEIEPCRREP